MAPRKLRVLAVDEDADHANHMRSMLPLFFHVTLYISSQSALNFIKDHADDVDFVFVAVSMEEMSGFQFLDIARKMHRNIQVILMSAEASWSLFSRAVAHGARFVAKKPLQESAMHNIWQYLDLSDADRTERIQHLFQGPTGGQSAAESGVTYSSGDHNAAEVESMDTSTSGMQGSPGNNIATKSIVNHPNSEVDETLKNCSEGNKGSEGSTSPMN